MILCFSSCGFMCVNIKVVSRLISFFHFSSQRVILELINNPFLLLKAPPKENHSSFLPSYGEYKRTNRYIRTTNTPLPIRAHSQQQKHLSPPANLSPTCMSHLEEVLPPPCDISPVALVLVLSFFYFDGG